MNSWSSPLGGPAKTATRVAMPLCTRSAASSAPAPPEPSDTTMMSAGATGSLTTSAHPAARRTGSRTEGTATMVAAANATTTRIGAHLGRRELMLGTSRVARQRCVPSYPAATPFRIGKKSPGGRDSRIGPVVELAAHDRLTASRDGPFRPASAPAGGSTGKIRAYTAIDLRAPRKIAPTGDR